MGSPSKSRGAHELDVRSLNRGALEIGRRIAYWQSGYRSYGGGAQGGWTGLHRHPEGNATHNPVNQRIVAGEPAMSQDDGARAIQQSDIKSRQRDLTRSETDGEVDGLRNCRVGSPIEQTKLKQRYGMSRKSIIINKRRIYKTIR